MKQTAAFLLFLAPAILFAQAQTADQTQSGPGDIFAPINSDLPSWLKLSGEYRIRAEGYEGGSYKPDFNQGYLLSRLQLNLDARKDWFRLFIQGEDARVFGNNDIPKAMPYWDTADLRQAFVEIGDGEKGMFGIRAGRQELNFADQRILGSANWLNTPRTFDAVRADLNYKRLRVDAFSSSVVVDTPTVAIDHSVRGDDLHGLYGTISNVLPGATIEPYVLWHLGRGFKTEEGFSARRSVRTYAIRVARKPGKQFDYEAHLLKQEGNIGADSVSAYAMNLEAGWKWIGTKWQPRLYYDYAFASGDHHAKDGEIGTFDQIYPSNHGLYGIVDLFGFQNLRDEKVLLEARPSRKLLLTTGFHNLNLASATDALYNGLGKSVVRVASGIDGTHLGEEWEATATYTVNKNFLLGPGYAHLFPGQFLEKATKGSSYSIGYLYMTYSF